MFNEKDQLAIDTIRALSIDAIEKLIQVTLDYLWEQHQWLILYGHAT